MTRFARTWRLWVMVALVASLAGCSSVAAPSPTPSPTRSPTPSPTARPTPTPTPTPVDATPAFIEQLRDPTFTARAAITGSATVGALTIPITGSMEVAGDESHTTMSMTVGREARTSESVVVDGRRYQVTNGLWFEVARETTSEDLGAIVTGLRGFTDRGVEDRDGVEVHRLELASGTGLSLAAFGMTDPTIRGGRVDLTAFSLEDGTPVAIVVDAAWAQVVQETEVDGAMTFEMAFTDVGTPVRIDLPEEVWAWYASEDYGYRIAYPAAWELEPGSGDDPDFFSGFDLNYVIAWRENAQGTTLAAIVNYIKKYPSKWLGGTHAKIDRSSATTLAGVKAHRIEARVTWDGEQHWLLQVIAVRGKSLYYVAYALVRQPTAADRALFDNMLSTFSFS